MIKINIIVFILATVSYAHYEASHEANDISHCDGTKAEKALFSLAKRNMYLRVIVRKYEFRAFRIETSDEKRLKRSERFNDLEENDIASDLREISNRSLKMFRIIFRVESHGSVTKTEEDFTFYDKETNYIFSDGKNKTKVDSFHHAYTMKNKATLKISGKKKEKLNLNIEFILGPKENRIHDPNPYFHDNRTQKIKNDAILTLPFLEVGGSELITYQIFMYLVNKESGGSDPEERDDQEVNKMIKSIIRSSNVEEKFDISSEEKVISLSDKRICGVLKPWIKTTSSNTVQIDLFKAVQSVVQHPEDFLHQGFDGYEFSAGPARYISSVLARKLFDKYFKKLQHSTIDDKEWTEGRINDMEFSNKAHVSFMELMKQNFAEYRKATKNKFHFSERNHTFDANIKHVVRDEKDDDVKVILDRMFKNGTINLGYKEVCCK